jgi:hypothetical protein
VTNGIPLGSSLLLPVCTVNCAQTLKVTAEDAAVVVQTQNYTDFLGRYFRHQSDEDLPGVDVFKEYVITRYAPLMFSVGVTDGQLNLECTSSDTYACAIQGVVIFPTSKSQSGAAFLDELLVKQKEEFDNEYVQAIYTPTGGADGGTVTPQQPFQLFHRHPEVFVQCSIFDMILRLRMLVDPTHVRLRRICVSPIAFLLGANYLTPLPP